MSVTTNKGKIMNYNEFIVEMSKLTELSEKTLRALVPDILDEYERVSDFLKDFIGLTKSDPPGAAKFFTEAMLPIQHTEQKVLFIPESDLNLDEGWHVQSAQKDEHGGKRDFDGLCVIPPTTGVKVTIRKTH